MKKNIIETIKDGRGAFYIKFHHYPTHLKIGRGMMKDVIQWEEINLMDFSQFVPYHLRLNLEWDVFNRDALELS